MTVEPLEQSYTDRPAVSADLEPPGLSFAFQRLVALAAGLLEAPIAMIWWADASRAVLPATFGMEDSATLAETSIEYLVCRQAVKKGRPLIAFDGFGRPHDAGTPTSSDHDIVAYAALPMLTLDSVAVGTICVMDRVRRDWTDDQLAFLAQLADIVVADLGCR